MSPRERTLSPAPGTGRSFGESARFHLARWVPLVGAAVVGYALFPPPAVVITAVPSAGQVADRTVVAPFSFETPKSPEEITSEGESRAFSVRPVYRYSPTAYDSALAKARSFFGNHSATVLMEAGKLAASPRPRAKRAMPKPSGVRARA